MGLEMKVKRAVLKEIACKYQRSSKKGKGQVLEGLLGLIAITAVMVAGYCATVVGRWR